MPSDGLFLPFFSFGGMARHTFLIGCTRRRSHDPRRHVEMYVRIFEPSIMKMTVDAQTCAHKPSLSVMTWTCSLDSRNTRTSLRSSHTFSFVELYCFQRSVHGIRFLACSSLRPCHHCFGGEIGASFIVFGRLRKVTSAEVPALELFLAEGCGELSRQVRL